MTSGDLDRIAVLEAELAAAQARQSAALRDRDALINSISWRTTRPLRILAQALRLRVRQLAPSLGRAVRWFNCPTSYLPAADVPTASGTQATPLLPEVAQPQPVATAAATALAAETLTLAGERAARAVEAASAAPAAESAPAEVAPETPAEPAAASPATELTALPPAVGSLAADPPRDRQQPALTRAEILLAPVAPGGRIIEIGPSFNPIAPKSEGWNSASIDHLTRGGLIEKYTGQPGVDVSRIEPVDFVWTSGSLSDAVPRDQHGTFDAFVASHVIEHTPDLIDFLDSAAALLKPDGLAILVIPDKRYCFDYFQPLTTSGQLLEAHADRRSRHTRRLAFDHLAYMVADGGCGAWGQRPSQGIRLAHQLEEAQAIFGSVETSPDYVDVHAWRFVPASFELLLLELARLGATDWQVARTTPPEGCEFFAWLRRGGAARAAALAPDELAAQRLALLKRTLLELRPQIDWLLAGDPSLAAAP